MSKANSGTQNGAQSTNDLDDNRVERTQTTMLTRRRAMQAGAGAVALAATSGMASAQDAELYVNWSSSFAPDPKINATATVENMRAEMGELEWVDDSEEVSSLEDEGVVLAERVDESTPHNPVTLTAADLNAQEMYAFPRNTYYDKSGDGEANEPVSALDSTHWTKDVSGSAGTATIADGSESETLRFSASSQTSGDVAIARLDLTTVGSEDATISDPSTKEIQSVLDVDALGTGVTVEIRAEDSAGTQVAQKIVEGGDDSQEDVIATATGTSIVGQTEIGSVGSLDDIVAVELAILDGDADVLWHGLNMERPDVWTFGTQEYTNSDGDLDTQEVEEPSGTFSITSLSTLPDEFLSGPIASVTYDVELAARAKPPEDVMVRRVDPPSAYDRPHEIEMLVEWNPPSGYNLSISAEDMVDEQNLQAADYIKSEVATGISDIDDFSGIEDVSWTSRTSSYGSVGDTIELFASVAAADRTAYHVRLVVDDDKKNSILSDEPVTGGAAVTTTGGGGAFDWFSTLLVGGLGGLAFWKRDWFRSLIGGS